MTTKVGTPTLITLVFLPGIIALRNFNIILTDSKCIASNIYLSHVSCTVNKSLPTDTRLSICAYLLKEIRDIRLDLAIELIRPNGDTVTLFKANNLNGCTIGAYENVTLPILKMYKDVLLKYGNWPKHCPIPVGFEYKFIDISLDPEYLPSFVPNADFKVTIIQYDKKLKFFNIGVFGKISHKRKNKGSKNF